MIRKTMIAMSFALVAAAGCATDSDQTLSGQVSASTFPEPVTSIVATGETGTITSAVASDGSFTLSLPAGDRYRIELVSAAHHSLLVYPRTGGALDTTVYVAGAGAFDLGTVQHVALDTGSGGGQDGATASNTPDDNLGGSQDTGTGGGHDTGTGGGQDTGTGGGGDTGGGGGTETGGGSGH